MWVILFAGGAKWSIMCMWWEIVVRNENYVLERKLFFIATITLERVVVGMKNGF